MTRLANKTAIAAIASAFMAVSVLPAEAMPVMNPASSVSDNIETVQYRGGDRRHHGGGHYRHGGRNYHNGHNNGHGWGHRPPPRHHRYDDDNDSWVPLAILGAGALIIGGAVASNNQRSRPQQAYGLNPKHYNWCESRYRSYRPSDNSFQPYNGPRKQCLSPYY
ncbi:BA14K family protein [Martelella mangrovi]|uniref:Lectin-like protein BA14k n=1 Tax=Martelella mangrovi TaxID=1397477 RepID=A0ABV2IC23_9HYPH|nr:BA14K family protein [uncultured Martelella sp.]